ncbi:predicted protein [Histoplasma capsulatum var. duboisii H88]|uniref:Predicted protein n=1 Tax=Ajellomyces capsulatus (strain H88) TaxID=544711 RepID=F0UK27_AJEC8|nr:predicted protein [Histoplasma capsulatum var. duboisii H88]
MLSLEQEGTNPSGQQPRSQVDWLIGVQLVQHPWRALLFNPESGLASCDCKVDLLDSTIRASTIPRFHDSRRWLARGFCQDPIGRCWAGSGPRSPHTPHLPSRANGRTRLPARLDYVSGVDKTRLGPPARCSLADVMAVLFLANPRPPSFTADRC